MKSLLNMVDLVSLYLLIFIILTGKTLKSLLNMVDLAGSERQKDAMTTGKILFIFDYFL